MNDDTLLLRQINPRWIKQSRVTSQAFRPTPKDNKQLSVYDGDQITPEEAWRHFTETQGFRSIGVHAVSVAECAAEELDARPDPEPFPEHVVIDFTPCASEGDIRRRASRLRDCAEKRNWLFRADAPGD